MAAEGFIRRSLGMAEPSQSDNQMWSELGAEQAGMANVYAAAGFANLMDTPAAQQGVMEAGLKTGEDVKNALRNRYFQTEWEQIKSTKVDPIMQTLAQAQADLRGNLSMAQRPTPRMVGPVEGQQISETLQGQEPGMEPVDQGSTATGGAKPPAMMTVPAPPAANPALNPGQIGATMMEDNLTLMDPVTGNPVKVDSARGITIMQQHVYDFMDKYEKANTQLLDIISSYPGNPYAQQAGHNIIDNAIKQAGQAVTGQFTPEAQVEWWQKRKAFEAQIEAQKTQTSQGVFNLQSGQGIRSAGVRRAESLAADPQYSHYFDSKGLGEKLLNQQQLSPAEEAEASGTAAMIDKLAAQGVAKDARSGRVIIPDFLQAHPGDWQNFVQTKDPEYRTILGQEENKVITAKTTELAQMNSTPEGKKALAQMLTDAGAPDTTIDYALRGQWEMPDVKSYIKTMIAKNNPGLFQKAADGAYIQRLRQLEDRQPELGSVIDQSLNDYIDQLHDAASAHGADFGPEKEAVIRADRYRSFFAYHSQRTPPAVWDPQTSTRVNEAEQAYRASPAWAEEIKDYHDAQVRALGGDQPTGPLSSGALPPLSEGPAVSPGDEPVTQSEADRNDYFATNPEIGQRLDAMKNRSLSVLGQPKESTRVSHEEVNQHGDEQAAAVQEQQQGTFGPLTRREPFKAAPSGYDLLSVDPKTLSQDQVAKGTRQLQTMGEQLSQQNTPQEVWQQYHAALERFNSVRWGDLGDTANRVITGGLENQTQSLEAEQQGNQQIVDFVLKTIGEANTRNEQRKQAEIESLSRGK